jgi:cobalamin biosynthesis Co2+ chelatase CbiK
MGTTIKMSNELADYQITKIFTISKILRRLKLEQSGSCDPY